MQDVRPSEPSTFPRAHRHERGRGSLRRLRAAGAANGIAADRGAGEAGRGSQARRGREAGRCRADPGAADSLRRRPDRRAGRRQRPLPPSRPRLPSRPPRPPASTRRRRSSPSWSRPASSRRSSSGCPANPRVLKPLEETGQYGGTWRRAFRGLADRLAVGKLMEERLIEWDAPDPNTLKRHPERRREVGAERRRHRVHLLPAQGHQVVGRRRGDHRRRQVLVGRHPSGTRSSCRHPALPYLDRQRIGNEWKPADADDRRQVHLEGEVPGPNPLLPIGIAKSGGNHGAPERGLHRASSRRRHYLKQFQPKYANGGKEDLDKMAQEKKLQSWVDLWGKGGDMDGPIGQLPAQPGPADAQRLEDRRRCLPADPIRMVRNPYYWQVDDQGNQLPYIDAVEHAFFENAEVFKLWIAQGKIDCQNRSVDVGAYTFFKENESKGDYRVLHWRSASTETYFPNQNTPGPGPGQAVRHSRSSARRSTSRSTARRSPRSSSTACSSRASTRRSRARRSTTRRWSSAGPSTTRRRRTTCWTGSA